MFGTPIISDNGLPLLTENIFQTPPPLPFILTFISTVTLNDFLLIILLVLKYVYIANFISCYQQMSLIFLEASVEIRTVFSFMVTFTEVAKTIILVQKVLSDENGKTCF